MENKNLKIFILWLVLYDEKKLWLNIFLQESLGTIMDGMDIFVKILKKIRIVLASILTLEIVNGGVLLPHRYCPRRDNGHNTVNIQSSDIFIVSEIWIIVS